MKRTYQKPMLLLERFSLKQSITASCTAASTQDPNIFGAPNSADKTICGWKVSEQVILWLPQSNCTFPLDADAEGYGVCYNNPGNGYTIFNS